jgi:hypothetical protein
MNIDASLSSLQHDHSISGTANDQIVPVEMGRE